jgi:capsular exopolysaccharide synthesis family protein
VLKFTILFAFGFGIITVLIYIIRLLTKVTISDEKSLSERYNIPVLGAVPDFFKFAKALGISKKDVNLNNKLKKRNLGNEKIITTATIIGHNTPFPIDSAYKAIRQNLMFRISTMDDKGVFVITSPTANDLKTTTTINIAISMAQMGAKVLLVDADMRNPSIFRYFKVSNKRGLSRILMGFETFDESVFRDVRPGVDFISAGPSTPSPAELLGSNYMIDFVNTQSEDYDFVFIDTSPINLVSDSLTLASMSSGIIITARENKTRYPELDRAINSMRMAKANIMGFILTDANSGDTGYGHYGYGYGYGYGYSEVKGKNEKKKNSGNIDDDDYDDDYEDYNWGNIVKDSVAPASEKDENLSEDE